MSKYIPGNQKHLTLDDRKYIESELNKGTSFKDIARFLCKDPTTISKEVKSRRVSDWYHKGTFYNAHNFCIHRYHCKKTNACGKLIVCGIKCASCPTCNKTCKSFEKERCPRLNQASYVCNGCSKKINHCTIAHKYSYDAIFADRKYRETLSSSRAGINLTQRELHQKDKIITPLIEQGQSPYHILANHPEPNMSVRTMYTYLDMGLFTARNVDLKRKVRFRPRKCHKAQITDREVFTDRLYSDFRSLGLSSFVEMDTVHSSRESKKTLLTMFFVIKKLWIDVPKFRIIQGSSSPVKRFPSIYAFISYVHKLFFRITFLQGFPAWLFHRNCAKTEAPITVNIPATAMERLLMAPSISPISIALAVPTAWAAVPIASP